MNIFSQFHWLAPLTRKKSSHVKKELQQIYKEHRQSSAYKVTMRVNSNVRLNVIAKVGK